ncbi:MAG: T9SS type A sorting domain-containing protein [Bacteroidota bacterium]
MNFINCFQGRGMFNFKPHFLLLLVAFFLVFSVDEAKSQNTLALGDAVITAYNSTGNSDTFAIMFTKDITSGTSIVITDGLWEDGVGYFRLNAASTSAHSEWVIQWQATSAISAFTQIKFWANAAQTAQAGCSHGSVVGGTGLSLTIAGDQIFVCQGGTIDSSASPPRYTPARIMTGLHANRNTSGNVTTASNWDNGATTSTSESELPDSLTTGTTAIWLVNVSGGAGSPAGEYDNARYDCSVVCGTATAVRAAVNDSDKWVYDNTTAYSPATCSSTPPTWNGTSWVGCTPSSSTDAIIASSTTPGAFTCNNLTINSGVSLTLSSGITATIHGDFTNNGNGTSGTGTLRFVKSGTQSLNGTAFTHNGVVEVATGATLTTNSKLTMANNASLMHGTSTPNGGGSISGSVAFQKTIGSTTKGWRMFALPVDALIDNFETGLNTLCSNHSPSGERNVYYWDPAAAGAAPGGGNYATGWTQANNSSDDENKAYSIYLDNNSHSTWNFSSTVEISGTPNDGTKTFSLQYTFDPAGNGTASNSRGWYMIPNYFPSNLSVTQLIRDGNFGSTYKAIHVWDQASSQMIGLNNTGTTMNTYNNSSTSRFSTTTQIPPFMGFWVKATSTSQSIQLKNSMRTSNTDSLPANAYFKTSQDIFGVTVKDADNHFDEFNVLFDEAATDGMDYTMDMYKFKSFSDEVPTLYTMVDGDMISLNALPVKTSYTMPLYMESFKNGKEYTFSPIIEEYLGYFDVELVDNKTGVKTQLLANNYSFKHDASYKGARFTLNFTKKSTTSIDELYSQEKMYVHTNEQGINVVYNNNNQAANAVVEIYNIMGQKLFTSNIITGGETVTYKPLNTAQANVYIAHIISNGKTKTIKVVY